MSSQPNSVEDAPPRRPSEAIPNGPGDRLALIGSLYDRHGARNLFHLAYAVCGDIETAGSSVVHAFETAAKDPHFQVDGSRSAHDLARLTFDASIGHLDSRPTPTGPFQGPSETDDATPTSAWFRSQDLEHRALLALTLFGDHTYREAAALLDLDPGNAAQMLRTMLRDSPLVQPDVPATTRSRP